MWKATEAFLLQHRQENSVNSRVCVDCEERRFCVKCKFVKPQADYSLGEWLHAKWNSARGRCKVCAAYNKTHKPCAKCNRQLPASRLKRDARRKSDSERICLGCTERIIGIWKCKHCLQQRVVACFSQWLKPRKSKKKRQHCSAR